VITFLHVGSQPWAEKMVASAKAITGETIIQLTDTKTPQVPGVDWCVRKKWNGKHLMRFRMEHLASFEGEHLTCDADVIFKAPVSDVWDDPFDIALTYRSQPLTLTINHSGEKAGADITQSMPINTGVMFCRTPKFFADCLEYMASLPDEKLDWWGDQMAVCAVAEKYNVKRLTCDEFNWTPSTRDHYEGARIVHYKGIRKKWLTE
jgi:hypothetical protein